MTRAYGGLCAIECRSAPNAPPEPGDSAEARRDRWPRIKRFSPSVPLPTPWSAGANARAGHRGARARLVEIPLQRRRDRRDDLVGRGGGQWLDGQDVARHHEAHHLAGGARGAQVGVVAVDRGAQQRQDLGLQEALQQLVLAGRRAQERGQRPPPATSQIPTSVASSRVAIVVLGLGQDAGERGAGRDRQLQRRGEEVVLGPEVVAGQRAVDAGLAGDGAQRRALEAVLGEQLGAPRRGSARGRRCRRRAGRAWRGSSSRSLSSAVEFYRVPWHADLNKR